MDISLFFVCHKLFLFFLLTTTAATANAVLIMKETCHLFGCGNGLCSMQSASSILFTRLLFEGRSGYPKFFSLGLDVLSGLALNQVSCKWDSVNHVRELHFYTKCDFSTPRKVASQLDDICS